MSSEQSDQLYLKGLADGYVLSLLPNHHVYLFAPEQDGQRFADLFRETWKRIPLGAKRKILSHWRKDVRRLRPSPRIELVLNWSNRIKTETEALATTEHVGHSLRFYSPIVERMPDNLVRDVIAHELAHVNQAATGLFTIVEPDELELDANRQMLKWGFDPYAMDRWLETEYA